MKANTIMALKKVMKEMVEKEVAKQINIVIDEMKNPTAQEVTAKDVHQAAEDADMEWDDDKNFMSLSKRITNKTHIDDMTSSERAKLISAIKTESIMDDADYYTGPEPDNRQLVKDPVLNKILNETKGGISSGEEFEAYPTMGGGAIDSPEKFYEQQAVLETAANGAKRTFSSDTPEFLKKAFSGHSAKVVKEVERKHGTRS